MSAKLDRADRTITVRSEDLCAVLEAWTGISANRLTVGSIVKHDLDTLTAALADRIFGQERAIEACVAGIRRRFQLPPRPGERRPIWTGIFAGPSGVGKTQLARELAAHFFGDATEHLVKVDLSEFREEHTAARLVGSPPGYVGHGAGGELTNALRKCRTGVLVLDEVEKAHHSILTTIVLPLLGDAVVHDMNDGKVLDVSNMIIVLTTNLGTNCVGDHHVGFSVPSDSLGGGTDNRAVRSAIADYFPREVLGRLDDVIVFEPVGESAARAIWRREVETLERRLASRGLDVRVEISEDVEATCLEQIRDAIRQQGARAIIRLFDRGVADKCLDLVGDATGGAYKFTLERTGEDDLRYVLLPVGEAVPGPRIS